MEKHAEFVLEAKTAKNCWEHIHKIYPAEGFKSCYPTREDAHEAKSNLKQLLHGRWKGKVSKYPIRIREIKLG